MGFLVRLAPVLLSVLSGFFTTFAGQIMAALGISVITYKGADLLQQQFIGYLRDHLSRMPSDVLQIFYLAGGGVALNWIFGATAFAFGLNAVSRIGSIIKQK